MFRVSALPRITFLGPGSLQMLNLAECGPRIQGIANRVSSLAPFGGAVGVVFQTSPQLVLAWLGVLVAGRVPLVLQYPNEKTSKHYWKESLRDTISRCQIKALLCAPELSAHDANGLAPCFYLDGMDSPGAASAAPAFPGSGSILQLSSGTTGFKKPIRFQFEALRRHSSLYNRVLGLTSSDHIVSWLPLYHDMGFIACFVMPLMLGIPIVMIDPMAWVREPRLLFDGINRFGGSVCFMPNFGFEVMAKLGKSGPFPTMRHWISCSEPCHEATLERFIAETGARPETLSTCYGMAENVFAVAQSSGMRVFERDGHRYVSCGRPIPQTEVKEVDGELCVRSPHSLRIYEGGEDIRGKGGFYATGDLGFIEDGEVVVTGRKQDLANIGGRKYLLNDWDFTLGELFPQSAGRIASLAAFDAASGTEKALFLIEAENFWEWERRPDPAQLISEATGVEWMEVHFVPPQFITKTSSGKINRKRTLEDWLACKSGVRIRPIATGNVARELAEQFPGLQPSRPALEQLDSLGQIILRMFCEEHGVDFTPDLTPERIGELCSDQAAPPQAEVFSIVALIYCRRLGPEGQEPNIDDAFLNTISKLVGCPVHFEHICVPPAPILFSDLIFHDYFLPRNPDPAYSAVASIMRKIKSASLILVDDEDNFWLPPSCAYPVLDHKFTMHPDAEFLGHRLQRYTQNHHLLPRRVVLGREILPENINPTLKNLENYLGVRIFKMAFQAHFRAFTEQWDFPAHREFISDAHTVKNLDWLGSFRDALLRFIREHDAECPRHSGEMRNRFVLLDSPHFCSFLLNRMAIDFVTRIYNSFCIVGRPSSIPYLQKRLDQLGKPYFYSLEANPSRDDYECLILNGGVGKMPATNKPTFDFLQATETGGGRPHNVPPEIDYVCPPLAACDEQLFRALRGKYGVVIGNFLLNHPNIQVTAGGAV